MPSNRQRREAAKRKLERQMQRREARARKRRLLTIAGSVAGVIVLVAAVVGVYLITKKDSDDKPTATKALGDCTYTETPGQPAARKVTAPPDKNEVGSGTKVMLATNQGPIPVTLDASKSPCAVNNFVSLAVQKYFDGTQCHRLTASPGLKVLQCGDPTGTGTGGPGYQFADEYPVTAATMENGLYKRGTLAMANSGPGTNGSQFFLVYGDSQLPPSYTIFGTIDPEGLATIDKVAAGGIEPTRDPTDGKPKLETTINTATVQ